METATKAALDLVEAFSSNEEVRNSVLLCLSEAPIGDEYQVCTADDWARFDEFEKFAEIRGVKLWETIVWDTPKIEYKSVLKGGTDATERNDLRRRLRNQRKTL